jgi:hypothetical protein
MTPRVRALFETRWNVTGKPEEGWVWPAPTPLRPHRAVEFAEATRWDVRDDCGEGCEE